MFGAVHVIPAKAGIQRTAASPDMLSLDPRFRGNGIDASITFFPVHLAGLNASDIAFCFSDNLLGKHGQAGAPATIHRKLARLKTHGLVSVDESSEDLRIKTVVPTPKALEYFDKLAACFEEAKKT